MNENTILNVWTREGNARHFLKCFLECHLSTVRQDKCRIISLRLPEREKT